MSKPFPLPERLPFNDREGRITPQWRDWLLHQAAPLAGPAGAPGAPGIPGPAGPAGPAGPIDSSQTLTFSNPLVWATASGKLAFVTLTGNTVLNVPTGLVAGTYVIVVHQDGVGSHTMTYQVGYKWPGGSVPTLSTTASAVDILTFVSDGTYMYGVAQKAFA